MKLFDLLMQVNSGFHSWRWYLEDPCEVSQTRTTKCLLSALLAAADATPPAMAAATGMMISPNCRFWRVPHPGATVLVSVRTHFPKGWEKVKPPSLSHPRFWRDLLLEIA